MSALEHSRRTRRGISGDMCPDWLVGGERSLANLAHRKIFDLRVDPPVVVKAAVDEGVK